jgi:hypothetical protein
MLWMLIFFVHVAAFLLLKNTESKKRDLEKKIHEPFIPVSPPRFPEYMDEHGNYDPDKIERERITQRNGEAMEEIDRVYKTVGTLRKLNKL